MFPWSGILAVPDQLGKRALNYLGGASVPGTWNLPKFGNSFRNGELVAQGGNLPSSGLVRSNRNEPTGEEDEEEEGADKPSFFDNRKAEIGFWMGASNPFPGSVSQSVLNTTLGAGLFLRIPWPWIFYLEFGASYANYLSRSERALTTIPTYGALVYKLPFEIPINFLVKAGGGESFVVARPANTSRWDKTIYAGFEASFIAGKKVRIGIRVDYYKILETDLEPPSAAKYNNYIGPTEDYRLSNPANYNRVNTEFFNFGLMLSMFL
ncbi:hypothetical protein EHO60_02620 [Leptospira fletcheri]|uniref:Outer membrane protein beta-barrel domain-containing protein n=1 Tax=Leptospira fletcheri TaxID=2484981 RepID=A0A4R9GKX7_9LEPT|nr:hypothetical protein [Leptospira fletcheri]TGK13191.1 hypothetical protein EHO60_02620 [Leptospira fletcheri]